MLRLMIFILLFPAAIFAQELNATVNVNMDQLNPGIREKLENFKSVLEDYLNKNKFTSKSWEGEKIQCSFNVFFTGATDDNIYTTQLNISSQRPIEGSQRNSLLMNIMDSGWQFSYEKNQSMIFNQATFDPITSMLDYYAYVILGFDGDSFDKLGGTDYYKQAYDITIRGASSKYATGWQSSNASYSKRGLLENLLDARYNQFRVDYYNYHYNGIDIIGKTKTYETAIKNIVKIITNLDAVRERLDSRSVLLKVFFDAKFMEICDALKNYPDKGIFNTLKRVDPYHISKYVEMSENK
jgi:hypothetical protein